jgi:3-phytase
MHRNQWIFLVIGILLVTGSGWVGKKLLNKTIAEKDNHPEFYVSATVETEPVPSDGDAADDPAIWYNEFVPSLSTVIGTDKDGGLAVYDLAGKQLQYLPDGLFNNVDIRYNFPLGGEGAAVVTAGNRGDSTAGIYKVNPATRRLENVAARKIKTVAPYGSCMYHSPITGKFYYVVNSK